MKALQSTFWTTLLGLAVTATTSMAGTFAQTGQLGAGVQFTVLNTGGTVSITGSGQDNFNYLVTGTPFGLADVLANFLLTASSTQTGACGSVGCPNGDSFTEQGYSGTFSYIVAGGVYAGKNLLSGTFNINGTPTNSGGKFSSTVGGTGGTYTATQTGGNPNGILMTSDFLNFAGVTLQTGSWGLSGLTPAFAVDPTATQLSKPLTGTSFGSENVATFSSLGNPTIAPEPTTLALMGVALVGLSLSARKCGAR